MPPNMFNIWFQSGENLPTTSLAELGSGEEQSNDTQSQKKSPEVIQTKVRDWPGRKLGINIIDIFRIMYSGNASMNLALRRRYFIHPDTGNLIKNSKFLGKTVWGAVGDYLNRYEQNREKFYLKELLFLLTGR